MHPQIRQITIHGYKSFRHLDLLLRPSVNVLIGANGAGKSNFIGLFRMLRRMMSGELQLYVAQAGGADQLLHYGRKATEELVLKLRIATGAGISRYTCRLVPAEDNLLIAGEQARFSDDSLPLSASAPSPESHLPSWAAADRSARRLYEVLRAWRVYHFHDTSAGARVKQMGNINQNDGLLEDAGNLAAYLYLLREKYPGHYRTIVETIRLAAPFFGDFALRSHPNNPEMIRLEWRERGSDLIFGPNALSDGMLRFICLAVLLLQPSERLPSPVILDEPELGLHPYAIRLLAGMVRAAAQRVQVVLATQSVTLVNQFTPEEVLVVERAEGASTIRRLDDAALAGWLEDYGLGDLWDKSVFGGHPTR
jgi:predicted ATPase